MRMLIYRAYKWTPLALSLFLVITCPGFAFYFL